MLDQLTPEEFVQWRAWLTVRPAPDRWDRPWAEFMTLVCRYLGALAGEERHHLRTITPERFAPWLKRDGRYKPRKQTPEELRSCVESAIALADARRNH